MEMEDQIFVSVTYNFARNVPAKVKEEKLRNGSYAIVSWYFLNGFMRTLVTHRMKNDNLGDESSINE